MAYFAAGTYAAVAMLAAAGISAYGMVQQGQTAKKIGNYNAKANELAALDAEKRGDSDAAKIMAQGAGIKGSARTKLAAAGLDLSDGTAAEIQDATDFFTESDANTARYNGRKDAASARSAGSVSRWQGDQQASQGNLQAFGTLLGGAARSSQVAARSSQVAAKWYTD